MLCNTKTVEEKILQLISQKKYSKGILLCSQYAHLQQEIEKAGGVCVGRDSDEIALVVACFLSQEEREAYLKLAKDKKADLLLAEGNMSWTPLALTALSGDVMYPSLYQECGCPVFNEKSLEQHLKNSGFSLAGKADIESDSLPDRPSPYLQKGSQLYQSIDEISKKLVSGSAVQTFVRLYRADEGKPAEQTKETQDSCFLTVVIRTQGNRIQALREAFLCLTAQDDTDFEVILVGHRVPKENEENLQELLRELPPMMQKRLRYFPLNTGGRAEPINFAAKKARGTYLAVFDDDDILMANWVTSFKEAYKRAPGSILHTYAVGQDWEFVSPRDKAGLRAKEAFDNRFCTDFDWGKQFHTNYCPLMTLGFPTYLWQESNQSLDNSLEVTEDWEFLMRMASFCGVENEPEVTAIYRLWKNAENSYTKHDAKYWETQYKKITKRNEKLDLFLPKGSSEVLREAHQNFLSLSHQINVIDEIQRQGLMPVMDEKLYCDDGSGWKEENTITPPLLGRVGRFCSLYEDLAKRQSNRQLRWDPMWSGGLLLKDICASVTDIHGKQYLFRGKDIVSNGLAYEDGYLFLEDDPQVYFTMPDGFVPDKFMVTGVAQTLISVKELSDLLRLQQYLSKNKLKSAAKLLLGKDLTEPFRK